MKRKLLLLFSFLVWIPFAYGQSGDTSAVFKDDQIILKKYFKELYTKNPDLAKQAKESALRLEKDQKEYLLKRKQKTGKSIEARTTDKYIIPVVVHIIHNNGVENVSDEKVLEAIRGLNEDYNLKNRERSELLPAFKDREANLGIEFRLAQIDPKGNPTTGITRTLDPQTKLVNEAHPEVKIATAWPRERYLNIWVVRNATEGNNSGYAFLPTQCDNAYMYPLDGIVMASWAFGETTQGFYSILTHEVGHWLSLRHTWGGDAPLGSIEACGDDDGVADTPNTIGYSGSCSDGIDFHSCGSLSMIQNFMDYAMCTCAFTEGQKEKMLGTLNSSVAQRNNLWTPENLAKTLFITPTPRIIYSGEGIKEGSANDGSFTSTLTLKLEDGTLSKATGNFTAGTHYTVTGVPAGLTVKLAAASATAMTFSFTGSATAHTAALSGKVELTILPAAITGTVALYNPKLSISYLFKDPYKVVVKQQTAYVSLPENISYSPFDIGLGKNSGGAAWTYDDNLRFENWGDPVVCNSGTMNVTPLTLGTSIGSGSAWKDYGSMGSEWYQKQFFVTSPSFRSWNGKTGYLGWKVLDDDNLLHYAWARLVVANDGSSYRVTATGYNEMPETAIKAGETDGRTQMMVNELVFNENKLNYGSYQEVYFELFNDEFTVAKGNLVAGTHYTISGVPDGLTASLEVVGANTIRMKLVGFALHHEEADVATIKVSFLDAALKKGKSSLLVNNQLVFTTKNINAYKVVYVDVDDIVINSTNKNVQFQLKDQPAGFYNLVWDNGTLQVSTGGDRMYAQSGTGNITLLKKGELIQKSEKWKTEPKLYLSKNDFFDWRGESGYAAVEFFDVTPDKGRHYAWFGLEVSADGQSVILKDYAFNEAPEGSLIAGMGNKVTGLTASSKAFTEDAVSDGGFSEGSMISLSCGRFASKGILSAANYTVTGVPAGLTAKVEVKTDTSAILTLVGKATLNKAADSTAFTFKLAKGAVVNGGEDINPAELKFKVYYSDMNSRCVNLNDLLVDQKNSWVEFNMEIGKATFYHGLWKQDGLIFSGDPMICHTGTNNLTLLPEGAEIGQTVTGNQWVTSENEEWNHQLYSDSFTEWKGKTGYVGIKLTYNDAFHYAWVRLTVAADGKSYFIHDFGASLIPGASIKAGDTGSGYREILAGNDTYTEPSANNGYVAVQTNVKLLKGKFKNIGTLALNTDYTVENLPEGVTCSLSVVDAGNALLSFSGVAKNHEAADSKIVKVKFLPATVEGVTANVLDYFFTFKDKYKIIYIPINAEAYGGNPQTIGLENYNDYTFQIYSSKTFLNFQTWASREVVCSNGTRNVAAFNGGDLISGGTFNWVNTDTKLPEIVITSSSFSTHQGKPIYLGIRKLIKGEYYYGWVQLIPSEDGHTANVVDMAFSTEPNGPIFAGEKVFTLKVPRPAFTSNIVELQTGGSVNFYDMSEGNPEQRSWIFEGGVPAASNEKNPVVTYSAKGSYRVSLVSYNSAGKAELVKQGYIKVYPNEKPAANFEADRLLIPVNESVLFTDKSTVLPNKWVWAFEGGVPATSSEQNPKVKYPSVGEFKVTLTATNNYGLDMIVKNRYVKVVKNDNTYCAAANTSKTDDISITNVKFASIDNTSDNEDLYGNYTSQVATVKRGQVVPFSMIVNNGHWESISTAVWIDWNQDGDFDEPNETILYHTDNESNLFAVDVTVPSDAKVGLTRMRVRNSYTSSVAKCGNATSGDVEDYSVLVDNLNVDFVASSTSIKMGETVTLTDKSTHNPNYWKWELQGADKVLSEEQSPVVRYSYPGTYAVKLTVSNGTETGTTEKVGFITVSKVAAPTAMFKASQQTVLKDGSVEFTDLSKPDATAWQWTFLGGTPSTSTAKNPVVKYATVGSYDVTLIATNATGSNTISKTGYIKVVTAASGYCATLNNAAGTNTYIEKVDFGTISNASNANSGYGNYTKLSTPVVLGSTVKLDVAVKNKDWNPTGISAWIDWNRDGDFDDANEMVHSDRGYDPEKNLDRPTIYTKDVVVPTTASVGATRMRVRVGYYDTPTACGGDAGETGEAEDYTVIVCAKPVVANFTASKTQVLKGESVTFTDASLNSPTSRTWRFDGGNPSTSTDVNPSVTYSEKGTFAVSLAVKDASMEDVKTVQGYITVSDPIVPVAFFVADKAVVMEGDKVSFTDNSLNTPTSWEWTVSGSGTPFSTAQNSAYTFTTQGTYDVTLKASNANGAGLFTRSVEVKPVTAAASEFISSAQHISVTDKVTFSDASANRPNAWVWTFEGGTPATSTDQNPTVQYNTEGQFAVTLVATNKAGGKPKTVNQYITVVKPNMPVASFTSNVTAVALKGDVKFTSTSVFTNTYHWIFEGGIPAESDLESPVVKYLNSGSYRVTLVASNAYGSNQVVKESYVSVSPSPNPVTDFTVQSTTVNLGTEFTFTDATTNSPKQWKWLFPGGTPSSSSLQNPSVKYSAVGTYNVSLEATNDFGANTMIKNGFITVVIKAPIASFTSNVQQVVAGSAVAFTDASTGVVDSRVWTFEGGTPATSTEANPSVVYATPGSYKVKLTVTNVTGVNTKEVASYIKVVAAAPAAPVASFTSNVQQVVAGSAVAFTDASTGVVDSRVWTFEGGTPATSTEANPSVVYATPGSYKVTLTVTNVTGVNTKEVASYIKVVAAAPAAPIASFTSNVQQVVAGSAVAFTDASTGVVDSRVWTFEGGTPATSTEANPSVVYATSGSYKVTLTVTNVTGVNTKEVASYITVLAKPVASFTFNATPVVQGSRIQFTNTSTSSTSYQWTFEGGTPASSTELNPTVTYSKSGSYKVSLTAINALGSNTKEQTVLVTIIPKTEDVATKAVKVYPNPFSGEFTLDFTDSFTGEILVNIFEMNGALVSQKRFDKQQETFNVKITSGLKSGVYLLQVQSGTNTYNTRVISIN